MSGHKRLVQTVIDAMNLDDAVRIADKAVECGTDWLGVGTALMYGAGFNHAIPAFKKIADNIPVVANIKTHDGGYTFSEKAYALGAEYASVSAISNYGCCREGVRAQNALGVKIIADLVNVREQDIPYYAAELESIGVHTMCIHLSYDDARYYRYGKCSDGVRAAKGVLKKTPLGCVTRSLWDVKEALAEGADWIALTGDMVNLGGQDEFAQLKECINYIHGFGG
jgi:3-keto-L-gulonate-6-phosphate decarboxylase